MIMVWLSVEKDKESNMPGHIHLFQKYRSNFFIETGSFMGESIAMALQCEYPNIRSVEIDEQRWQNCLIKFHNYPQVQLYCGSTEDKLWEMIKDIHEPCTFWLDAHFSPTPAGNEPKSHQNCPLLDELDIIKRHPIKNHTIMIDDIRCCDTNDFTWQNKDGTIGGVISRSVLEHKLLEINPNYKLTYEHSWEPFDILVGKA
jgi:hypothetical protein